MALTKFKVQYFSSAVDLQNFVQSESTLASVVDIIFDGSGQYVLFYMTA